MSQPRHRVFMDKPGFSRSVLVFLLSALLLGCGGNQATVPSSGLEQGIATTTVGTNQGAPLPAMTATTAWPITAAPEATSGQPVSPQPIPRQTTTGSQNQGALESIGRLAIPSLGVDLAVVEVSWHLDQVEGQAVAIWDTVAGAAGHHRGTTAFGGAGNCVISGHSRAQDDGVFNNLWTLEPGALIDLTDAQGQSYEYVVKSVDRVQELGQPLAQRLANASLMAPSQDARLTLITCWPDWAYTHRVIVVAQLR